jgi:beta-glucosidase
MVESSGDGIAREERVDVRGHWSAFDNFEWPAGYQPKFRMISIDQH